jgi:hypothetical protein
MHQGILCPCEEMEELRIVKKYEMTSFQYFVKVKKIAQIIGRVISQRDFRQTQQCELRDLQVIYDKHFDPQYGLTPRQPSGHSGQKYIKEALCVTRINWKSV